MTEATQQTEADRMIFRLRREVADRRDDPHLPEEAKRAIMEACAEAEEGVQTQDMTLASRSLYAAARVCLPDRAGVARDLIDLGGEAAGVVEGEVRRAVNQQMPSESTPTREAEVDRRLGRR